LGAVVVAGLQSAGGPVERFRRPAHVDSEIVAQFCASIAPSRTGIAVPCRSAPHARPYMCFDNVARQCDLQGGTSVCGWIVWEWKGTFLEAEHHAVWNNGSDLIDVTPHRPQWRNILFLPDPATPFDFATRRRVDNHRQRLRDDGVVQEYLAVSARLIALEEANSDLAHVILTPDQAFEAATMRQRLRQLEIQLAEWSIRHTGRNDPCWCGSGSKLKKCCASVQADTHAKLSPAPLPSHGLVWR
jgi:hypothetical protein